MLATMSTEFLPGTDFTPVKPPRIWPWVVLVGVLVVGLGLSVLTTVNQREPEYDPNNSREAISQCESAIEERLKAPTTAEFNSTATGDGTWTVVGTVDAQNSFGAMIRSAYQCSVIIDSEAGSARVRIDSFE